MVYSLTTRMPHLVRRVARAVEAAGQGASAGAHDAADSQAGAVDGFQKAAVAGKSQEAAGKDYVVRAVRPLGPVACRAAGEGHAEVPEIRQS